MERHNETAAAGQNTHYYRRKQGALTAPGKEGRHPVAFGSSLAVFMSGGRRE